MKRYSILEVCARIEGHAAQHQMLQEYCRGFDDWQGLLERAEREGMAPLLRKHLVESEANIPASARRSLNLLYKRHQKLSDVRLVVLEDMLRLFQQHGLTPILIKGTALCLTLYPDPSLRPMRDMDILLSKDEVGQAQELLREAGFEQSTSLIPPDHHHLPSLYKNVDEVKVCIELHRGLYPNCPPYYPEIDFRKLLESGQKISVGETDAFIFSNEETLHYLYQHGFRAPLTYETFKLINAADVIGYTEQYFQVLDWGLIQEQFPILMKALPLMHHISPFNFNRVREDFIPPKDQERKLEPRPFDGWPRRRRKDLIVEGRPLQKILINTFVPPMWWVGVYYGGVTAGEYLHCLLWKHPQQVCWWGRLYKSLD